MGLGRGAVAARRLRECVVGSQRAWTGRAGKVPILVVTEFALQPSSLKDGGFWDFWYCFPFLSLRADRNSCIFPKTFQSWIWQHQRTNSSCKTCRRKGTFFFNLIIHQMSPHPLVYSFLVPMRCGNDRSLEVPGRSSFFLWSHGCQGS